MADQSDAYTSALAHVQRFRIAGHRLEILDLAGETTLIFVRKPPLPGRPIDLAGTRWKLVAEEKEDGGDRTTTLTFLNDRLYGGVMPTATTLAITGYQGKTCVFLQYELPRPPNCVSAGRFGIKYQYTNDLLAADDYSVHDEAGPVGLRFGRCKAEHCSTSLCPCLPTATSPDDCLRRRSRTLVRFAPRGSMMACCRKREVEISFQQSAMSGSAGCNSYEAHVSLEGSTITNGDVSVTGQPCQEQVLEQERRYLDILQRVRWYHVFGDRLFIHMDDDKVLLFPAD